MLPIHEGQATCGTCVTNGTGTCFLCHVSLGAQEREALECRRRAKHMDQTGRGRCGCEKAWCHHQESCLPLQDPAATVDIRALDPCSPYI